MGRLAALIELSEKERGELEGLSRRRRTAQGLAQRAQIVLLAADGLENKAIAERAGAVENTVGKWRRRFAEKRLDGLLDEPRPGRPREIGDDEIAETVRLTLETTPEDATHWSLRSSRRSRALDHPSHLESLRPAAAPRGKLQAFDRSPVRGEGTRYCRALYGAA
jgi:transposase